MSVPQGGWWSRPWSALVEFALIGALFWADVHHYVVFSKVPFLFLLGWLSLRLRRMRWSDVGLKTPTSWGRTVVVGVAAGIAIELLELFVTQPWLVRVTGKMPDLSDLDAIHGNWGALLVALALTWTLAAFGEEMVYRGYLMNRAAGLQRHGSRGWLVSLVLVSVLFGAAHIDQGRTGMIENGIDGFLLGLVYLTSGKNLWAPIIAHGVTDTIDVWLLFLGKYPGLH